MRRVLALVLAAAVTAGSSAVAEVPGLLGYQGRLLKADGSAETGVVSIGFEIYDAATGGSARWSETQALALTDGYYATYLGAVTPLPADLFDGSDKYLALVIGGSPLEPRQRIATVPYALKAGLATSVKGGAVDATSLSINGQPVIDSDGRLAGSAQYNAGPGIVIDPATRNISLPGTCINGELLRWDGTTWSCSAETAYRAGSGLELRSGSFSLLSTCASGQILAFDGTAWNCAEDQRYAAGTGLALDGSTFSLTKACAADEILKWTGAEWACSPDLGLRAESDPTVSDFAKAPMPATACTAGQKLAWDGTAWSCVADRGLTTESDPTVKSFAKSAMPATACTASQKLAWDGTAWSCVADQGLTSESDPTVKSFAKASMPATACSAAQKLAWDGTAWSCVSDQNTTYTGGTGVSISGTTISGAYTAGTGVSISGATISGAYTAGTGVSISGATISGAYTAGTGITISGATISANESDPTVKSFAKSAMPATACTASQKLAWDGTAWSCVADQNTTYSAGTGISLSGTTINGAYTAGTGISISGATISGAYSAGTGITISGATISANESDPTVKSFAKASMPATACTASQKLAWDGTAWSCVADSGLTTETDPTVKSFAKAAMPATDCSAGQKLAWNGTTSTWSCVSDSGITTETDPTVKSFAKASMPATDCSAGQKLSWNSTTSTWSCVADLGTTYTGGTAISIVGTTISGAYTAGTGINITGAAISAVESDPTVKSFAKASMPATACAASQKLAWDGTAWSCVTDQNTTYGAGSGLSLSGTTFSLPACTGGQILKYVLGAWTCAADDNAGGTVTSVSAAGGTPLSVTSGTTTPVVSITQASASTNGYLSATDWNTFNNKASATQGRNLISWTTDISKWSALAGSPTITLNTADVLEGDASFDVNITSGASGVDATYGDFIPVDPSRVYEGRISAKMTTGAGTFYAGYIAYNSAKAVINGNGGTYGYFIASAVTLTSSWQTFKAQISGEGTAFNPGTAWNQFPAGTRFIKPFVITNYQNVGNTRLDAFAIYEVDDTRATKNVNGSLSTYGVTQKRYHVEATKSVVTSTVALDQNILNELCRDDDGCSITLSMKNWDPSQPGNVASRGPFRFFMSQSSNWWRISNNDTAGLDGNSGVDHVIQAWDCYFTDGTYSAGAGTDPGLGFGLLNWNATYTYSGMVCMLDIDD